jgi:hypothetical protein
MVLVVGKSGAEGNMMHEKTRSRKSREMVPLKVNFEDQPSFVRNNFQPFFICIFIRKTFPQAFKKYLIEEKKFPQIV